MPELPDVELFKRYAEAHALHQRIARVEVQNASVLEDVSPKRLPQSLEGRRFETSKRHGKYLFLATDGGLVLHFGMTGYLYYLGEEDETPRLTRVLFHFDNGSRLAYVCQRMLGKVALTEDLNAFIRSAGMGPDALAIERKDLEARLAGSTATAKGGLMAQELVAGIGNIYGDEILFQARLHPKKKLDSLPENDLKRLTRAVPRVLEKAIEKRADPASMPSSFLLPHREAGQSCPRWGGKVEKASVGGRATYFCSRCQPRD